MDTKSTDPAPASRPPALTAYLEQPTPMAAPAPVPLPYADEFIWFSAYIAALPTCLAEALPINDPRELADQTLRHFRTRFPKSAPPPSQLSPNQPTYPPPGYTQPTTAAPPAQAPYTSSLGPDLALDPGNELNSLLVERRKTPRLPATPPRTEPHDDNALF